MVTHEWVEGMVHGSDARTLGQISASAAPCTLHLCSSAPLHLCSAEQSAPLPLCTSTPQPTWLFCGTNDGVVSLWDVGTPSLPTYDGVNPSMLLKVRQGSGHQKSPIMIQ